MTESTPAQSEDVSFKEGTNGLKPDSKLAAPADISAARRMYDITELRTWLLKLVDRSTLARMMRLHREGMNSVTAQLYQKMHHTAAVNMGKAEIHEDSEGFPFVSPSDTLGSTI